MINKIKALSPIIVAFISLIGVLLVAWLQTYSASDEDLRITLAKIDMAVEQLNKFVIPEIQRNFQVLQSNESVNRERIAKIEGIIETLPRHLRVRVRDNPIKDNPGHKFQVTRVPVIDIKDLTGPIDEE